MKSAVCVVLVGCSGATTLEGQVQQEIADPAPVLSVSSVRFHDPVGGTSLTQCGQDAFAACASSPATQIRWGTPASGTDQSGLGYDAAGSTTIVYDSAFALGALTHFNFPTYAGTAATGVSLDLGIHVEPSVVGAALFDQTITIPFTIDETPNVDPCPYPSVTPCSDKITFGTSTFDLVSTSSFTIYELQITGFLDTATNTVVDGLISEENGSSTATLMAVLHEHCVDSDNNGICDEFDVDRVCPCDGEWKNHGEYVSCVTHTVHDLIAAGQLAQNQGGAIISVAGQSSCGQQGPAHTR